VNEQLSKAAAALAAKYPLDGVQAMGPAVLFPDQYGVEQVREWMGRTRFVKKGARMYLMEVKGVLIRAEIDRSTYGVWAVLLTGEVVR
jgi:hypothetical protein